LTFLFFFLLNFSTKTKLENNFPLLFILYYHFFYVVLNAQTDCKNKEEKKKHSIQKKQIYKISMYISEMIKLTNISIELNITRRHTHTHTTNVLERISNPMRKVNREIKYDRKLVNNLMDVVKMMNVKTVQVLFQNDHFAQSMWYDRVLVVLKTLVEVEHKLYCS